MEYFKTLNMKLFTLVLTYFISGNIVLAQAQKQQIDLLIYNAKVYTVDSVLQIQEAIAIKEGKIVAVGKSTALRTAFEAKNTINAKKKFVFPGFIDAHAHFYGYGLSLNTVNLVNTKSWEACIARVKDFYKKNPSVKWITGRGWDQNDWKDKQFPNKKELDKLFPNTPVVLNRIDGHAALCNTKALELANIKPNQVVLGGKIETINGELTGILLDNAVELINAVIPAPTVAESENALLAAQQKCFAQGLTTVADCGLDFYTVDIIQQMHAQNTLKMRLYVMLSDAPQNYKYFVSKGKILLPRLTVRAFKFYGDGALGSRGACLQKDYDDKPNWHGFMLQKPSYFDSMAVIMKKLDVQMCTHAIGDSANLAILNSYKKVLGGKNDLRWRIEHAQVVDENCFEYFKSYNIVPSVQPTHATSDMYWVKQRLGEQRLKNAYAYQRLLQQNDWIPLGTDFPVEDISPLKTFVAAVFRQDAKGFPQGGFQAENALTRAQALQGMTLWAAKAQFEENNKGSISVGKMADLVILDTDIMKVSLKKVLKTQVLYTILNGEVVYKK